MRKASKTNTLAKRHHIMRAALACFRRSGFHQASMADICTEARMSRGHVYHYFDSKEALIEAVVDENSRDVQQALKDSSKSGELNEQADFLSFLAPAGDAAYDAQFSMDTALALEIVVEASRNKRLRALLHKAMSKSNKILAEVVDRAGSTGQINAASDREAMIVLLKLIATGWNVLSLSDPDFDPDRFAALLRTLLGPLFGRQVTPTTALQKRRGKKQGD